MYATVKLIEDAVVELGRWRDAVQQQTSSHLYSFLAPKWRGAEAGRPLKYSEADDRDFWDEFFRLRDGELPYFDPLKSVWRTHTQWHSNTATQRKNRFVLRWEAATWDDDVLTLAPNYAEVFVTRVMTKAGRITRVPAQALAVWIFKRDDLPTNPADLVTKLKTDFHFSDSEFVALFDPDQ